jgi:hypothetical protein
MQITLEESHFSLAFSASKTLTIPEDICREAGMTTIGRAKLKSDHLWIAARLIKMVLSSGAAIVQYCQPSTSR